MNVRMWLHAATQRNVAQLKADGVRGDRSRRRRDGVRRIRPRPPARAAGHHGLARPTCSQVTLAGKHILVTAGPTHEPIDPVRVIANRSSGRQGFAIAAAAAEAGARVTLVAGPVALETPRGRRPHRRRDRRADGGCRHGGTSRRRGDPRRGGRRLAGRAVADQAQEGRRPAASSSSCRPATSSPSLARARSARACSSASPRKPSDVVEQAIAKRTAKRADWIVANDVSGDVMGGAPQPRAPDHRRRRRRLAGSEQGRGRAAADRADRRGSRLSRRPCSAGSAGMRIVAPARASRRRTDGACPPGSSPMPTMQLIASSAAKLPTVPVSAPSTPSSAQLSQSSASNASPTKQR